MLHSRSLTRNIFIALILGAAVGTFFPEVAPWVGWLGKIFKLSLTMIVMPIIFTSIIGGMGTISNVGKIERVGAKTLLYFLISTLIAICVGLGLVNIVGPGKREVSLALPEAFKAQAYQHLSMQDFLLAQIDKAFVNPFEALANSNVLAVIIFAVLFGIALSRTGELGKKVFDINEAIGMAIGKIVNLIMTFAPLGVFGLLVEVLANTGFRVFEDLAWYVFCVIAGLAIHMFIVLPTLSYMVTQQNPIKFLRQAKPVLAVAFSTSSSSATLPLTMNIAEENLKIPRSVSRFVLPLGSTVNMNGTALYEAVAALFVAQLYGIHLGIQGQIIVAFTATLAAVGAAGIPSAGTVTMALVLSAAGLPLEAIGLLLAVDRPLDMCRTAVNVFSDLIGCSIVHKIAKNDIKPARA